MWPPSELRYPFLCYLRCIDGRRGISRRRSSNFGSKCKHLNARDAKALQSGPASLQRRATVDANTLQWHAARPTTDDDAARLTADDDAAGPATDDDAARPTTDYDAAGATTNDDAARPATDDDAARPTTDDDAATLATILRPIDATTATKTWTVTGHFCYRESMFFLSQSSSHELPGHLQAYDSWLFQSSMLGT